MFTLRRTTLVWFVSVCGLSVLSPAFAEPLTLTESLGDRVFDVTAAVTIDGKIRTHAGGGATDERPLKATARFEFLERGLEALGSDAASRRTVRQYRAAAAVTTVDTFETRSALPQALSRVVVEGRTDQTVRFSLGGLMTREAVDLLDMPGDPIVLAALLPSRDILLEEEYDVPKWAAQVLCSLDVVTKSSLVGRVKSANDRMAYLLIEGDVEGARLGAPTKLKITGTLSFDREASIVSKAKISYVEDAEIGTISPGVMASTTVELTRSRSTETLDVAGIPVTVPESALKLYFDAPSWGVRMLHGRDWHVFYSAPDAPKPVVILRLLENGRLLSQMNLAKVPSVRAGENASLEAFERDIERSLGDRFGQIVDRSQGDRGDGVILYRVVAAGQFGYKQGDETKTRDMQWTYYLIVHPDGRQLSAIFAHEPAVAEQLGDRDLEIIKKLQFFAPQVASTK